MSLLQSSHAPKIWQGFWKVEENKEAIKVLKANTYTLLAQYKIEFQEIVETSKSYKSFPASAS